MTTDPDRATSNRVLPDQELESDLVYLWRNLGELVRDLLDEGFRPDDIRGTVEQALLRGIRG